MWTARETIGALLTSLLAASAAAAQTGDTAARLPPPDPGARVDGARPPFHVEARGRLAERPPRPVVVRLVTQPVPTETAPASMRPIASLGTDSAARRPTVGRAGRTAVAPSAGWPDSARRSAPHSPTRPRTHTVAAGETLYSIARRYGVSVADLRQRNGLRSDTIRVGQVLRLPSPDRSP